MTTTSVISHSIINTEAAPAPVGPYAQAVAHENVLYISGQLPLHPRTLKVEHPNDAVAQTKQILENIQNILEQAGSGLESVLKTTIFLTRISDFPAVSKTYGEQFGSAFPARSCIAVSALPHPNALVEIEAIAAIPSNTPVETAL